MSVFQISSDLRRSIFRYTKWFFTPLALFFLGTLLWQSRGTVAGLLVEVRVGWLAVAIAIWLAGYLLSPLFTVQVLRGLGEFASYRQLLGIFVSRLPAKYLPGGIWQSVARAYDLKTRGIQPGSIAQMLIYELTMPIFAALSVGGCLMLLSFDSHYHARTWLLAAALGGAMAMFCLPQLPRIFPKLRMTILSGNSYACACVFILLYWSLVGFSFAAFIISLDIEEIGASAVVLAGAYSFAWVVGYLALFAPQGLGVFEYTLNELIEFPLSMVAGISVIFCFRLLIVCVDLLLWALFIISSRGVGMFFKNLD